MPDPIKGSLVRAVGTRTATSLTYGKFYEVHEFVPAKWCDSALWQAPALVTVINDNGKTATFHATRFEVPTDA